MNQFEPNISRQTVQPLLVGAHLHGPVRADLLEDEVLAEIFAATVKHFPDALALTGPKGDWTYAALDAASTAIARGLLKAGVKATDIVGLWMPRGPELLIAQIAIAKTGAAWLPFDGDAPVERIAVCLRDAAAKLLVTSSENEDKVVGKVLCVISTPEDLAKAPNSIVVDARLNGATSDSPAYVIYTSGSTGIPKGILVSNRNICHYLRSANVVYGMTGEDIVFQGASVAFDLSMEEIWLPYLVGATLFVATSELMGEADKLPDIMQAAGITVLDTVPTLLAMLQKDIPSLRIIILGGESCPPAIANRWCRSNRTIYNSYGPTEATVVATISEVRPNEPVTIGRPIPNYSCYIVDEDLNLLEAGLEGELLIGGPGVAMGYLSRDELTAEKFIPNPFSSKLHDPILYRSGDAVILDEDGNIAFRGRIDDQVKLRGFRMELGEIEAKLADITNVSQAAVVVRQENGIDELVAFLVFGTGEAVSSRDLRHILRDQLPAYMVPGRFETVETLPKLSSGKVDRKALKVLPLSAPVNSEVQEDPETETEAALLDALKKVLPPQAIPFDADFFTELGGHSLLAARFVSIVRQTHSLASLTLQDMYAFRSLRAIGAELDRKSAGAAPQKDLSFTPPPLLRRFLCGLAQAIATPFILTIMTAQWLGVFISYMLLTDPAATVLDEIISLLAVYALINVATVLFVICAKWLVIGRIKPGRYPLWGAYYFRWWLVDRFNALVHINWFQGTAIMRYYLIAMGAKIGQDAIIGDIEISAVDQITIGAGSSIGSKANFACARVEGNEFIIGPIVVGPDCSVGSSAVLENNTIMEEGSEIRDLTAVRAGTTIGAWEIWDGSPAKKVGLVDRAQLPEPSKVGPLTRASQTFLYTVFLLIMPPLGLLPIFPAFYFYDRVDEILNVTDSTLYLVSIPLYAWPASIAMVIFTVLFIVALRWIIMPFKVKEGTYSVHSWFYLRKWVVAFATDLTLETLSSLYATLYMRTWYRLMGAKIGKDSEISTSLAGRFDLVEIGDKCFIADEVNVGDEDMRRGWIFMKKVRTGARVFIGNNGVLPPGANVPDGALVGIKSRPPANDLMSENDTWFGLPPIKFPVRQRFDGGGSNWTYEAPRWKKLARGLFETMTISLPTTLTITAGTWAINVIETPLLAHDWFRLAWVSMACACSISVLMTLSVVALKWVTIGRYEPIVRPMWSWWAMRTESVAVIYAGLANKVLLEHLHGTPMLPWILRLFGMKFGQGVYLDTVDFTEFDCVNVGSFVSINSGAALQTHLYEDRVMKIGRVLVQDGVTVGPGSTVLYDSNVGKWARLGPLTVVMKGESIPANTEWCGAPAEPRRAD
eukprot:gene8948-9027_t